MADNNNWDRSSNGDRSLQIRPSGAPALTSLDQLSYNYNTTPSSGEGFDLREIWRKVRKRKLLILSIVIVATTIVTVETFRNRSYYQAAAKIAFTQNKSEMKLGDLVLASNDNERINTDLLMIKTYPLLEDVVVMLRLDQNPQFLDGGRRSISESLQSIFSKFGSRPTVKRSPLPAIEPLVIEPMANEVRTAQEKARLAPYVQLLMNTLTVQQVANTRAIDVRFTHTDPEVVSNVANGVARVFIEYSYRNKTENFTTSANWLDRTTRSLQTQVQQAEQALASYSISHNLFGGSDSSSLTGDKLTEVYSQAQKAETDRILKQSIYEEVRKGRISQLPEAFSDKRSLQLRVDLNALQLKLAELNARFGPENPKIVETKHQIEELDSLITTESRMLSDRLRADYDRAVREESLIKESLTRAKSEAIQQNQDAIQFNILKQNVDTAKELYNDFLQKTNQVNIQRADQVKDLRIIDPARTPTEPVGPHRLRTVLFGLILSLGAGVGLALLIEYLDNSVKNIEDVMRATQLPTLAVIPAMNSQSLRSSHTRRRESLKDPDEQNRQRQRVGKGTVITNIGGIVPRGLQPKGNQLATLDGLSSVVEAYRMLRTSLLLSTAGKPPKTILLTSSQPGEGKTTTAVNTAISMAQLGSSVLLIDADMRRPTVHKTFKLARARGLSTYLSGNGDIESLIIKLPMPNLSVLTSGPIPPNPAELISSDRMRELLKTLSLRYDHIIIDSPPLITVTDPVILSTMVDGSMLVVQSGRSTKELIRRARQELAGVNARIFGVILNNVDIKRDGYDEYYYHRYYSNYSNSYRAGNGSNGS